MDTKSDWISPTERRIITGALKLNQPQWSSSDLAESLGLSQSAVARTWRKHFSAIQLSAHLPSEVELIGFDHVDGHSFITLAVHNERPFSQSVDPASAMRSPRRIPFQKMLAVSLTTNFQHAVSDSGIFDDVPASIQLPILILGTQIEAIETKVSSRYVPIPFNEWSHLLPYLIQTAHKTPATDVQSLHQSLITWSTAPQLNIHWRSSSLIRKEETFTAVNSRKVRSTQQVIADDAFEAIVELVWTGKLGAGDRITESAMARKLHTTRNQTRDALRTLASSGLVDYHPVRGVLIPSPKRSDVVDIYAARRALGTEIIRRVIQNPNIDVAAIESALSELIRIGKTGKSYEAGNADLHFQDVLAQNSGMRNIPQMFEVLGKQLRLYITVIGMTYLYSIDDMVADDISLLKCITAHDEESAIKVWNQKIDDAVKFMMSYVQKIK